MFPIHPRREKLSKSQQRIKILPVKSPSSSELKIATKRKDNPLILPEISNPLTRVTTILKTKQTVSSPVIKTSKSNSLSNLKVRSHRINAISHVIKVCEMEKFNEKFALRTEINRSQNQINLVVSILNKMKITKNKQERPRRKENEFYMTRIQMKKMREELRASTKHIGYS
jgi:hypothetical protein